MKTLLRRLSLAAAGFAMALGVGVAIGNAAKAVETRAEASTTGFFKRVVSTDEISAGDKIILVNEAGTNAFRTIEVENNYGSIFNVSASNSVISLSGDDVEVFTIENGINDGSYSFKGTENLANQYLIWNSGNTLGVQTEKAAKASWTISETDGVLTIANADTADRIMKFTSSRRVACYKDGTGNLAQIYRMVDVSAVSSLSATITAPQGNEEWVISNIILTGTLNGRADQDISNYIDLVPVTEVPKTTSGNYPVTIGFARKSGVLGNADLGTQVLYATVTEDVFMNYRPVKSVSALNTYTLYALGYADKTKFINTSHASVDTDTGIELFRLEPSPEPADKGKFYLRIVTGSSYPYTNGEYVNNENSSATVSYGNTASALWQPNDADGPVNLLNTSNENRWLSNYLKDESNYLGAYKTNQANTTKVPTRR